MTRPIGSTLVLAVVTASVLAAHGARPLRAQEALVRVVVLDSLGERVPFAYVQLAGGTVRIADDSGRVRFSAEPKDSVKLYARRVGYAPFSGWRPREDAGGTYSVVLAPLPRALSVVDVKGRIDSPLARSGFYDRVQRSQYGAISARFIAPEEIEQRNAARASRFLEGQNYVRVRTMHGRPFISGRGGSCPMGVVVDGQKISGMVEEMLTKSGEQEIDRLQRSGRDRVRAELEFLGLRVDIDQIVTALAVTAIEIYPTLSAAPAELQRPFAPETCGMVAIWTARR